MKEKTIELAFGYQDKGDETKAHRSVVFSKRPTCADYINALDESEGKDPQFALDLMASAISKFGDLKMPVPMTAMLSLNWIDQEQLQKAFADFLGETGIEGREAKILETGKIQLAFGVEHDGVKYDRLEFGKLLNGYDQIAINKEAKTTPDRHLLTIGREIVRLSSSSDESQKIDGGLTLDELKSLDYEDFLIVQQGVEEWKNSFRNRRAKIS
jgi:phage FluMu protein gp41